MMNEFDTIAAIATAMSNAGIGIIRISGAQSLKIISEIFEPYDKKIRSNQLESHRIYYGNIKDKGEVIDECIVLVMRGPRSYTREDVIEIDCHGGIMVVYKVLEVVLKHGARPAEPGEFTKRAFLNGRIDLSQAEAVMDLIDSKNESARKNSITQLKGGLSDKIKNVRKEVIYQIAFIESALDDPEHISLDGYAGELKKFVEKWILTASKMLQSYDNGRIISEGIRTCIVGKPNAGKSSFLNALLGEERAIVTEVAGTTRDTLEESVTIDGITLNIIDTAGIHHTEDTVEKIGVQKAKQEIENADVVLFLMDISEAISQEDKEILHRIRNKKKIILLNKSDLSKNVLFSQSSDEKEKKPYDAEEISNPIIKTVPFHFEELKQYVSDKDPVLFISAKYQEGIGEFISELKKMIFHGKIDANQEIYITSARHKHALEEALESFQCVRSSIEDGMPEDFFTIDLMNAYEKLGFIVGESVEEDLVNEIFSKFCTGK